MFPRWFDRRAYFDEDDQMAGRRRGPHHPPVVPPGPGDHPRGGRGWRGPGGPGFGPPGPGGPGFGPPGFGGFGGANWGAFLGNMFGRGPRARRGNVRSAILSLLAEQPHNGYQIMQAIEQRSHGQWRPSSGSIYPTLQQLEDEGLVEAEDSKPGQTGSKSYKLSTKGRRYVDDHRSELDAEWVSVDEDPGADPRWQMMKLFREVATAAMQVAQSGTAKQLDEAKQLLADVRRNLYRILAEVPAEDDDEG